jgi:NADP-dependent 3-hydroxy acid dehydrogenase YdfG
MKQGQLSPKMRAGARVFITGGTTGIGRAIALDLAGQGCEVFLCGTDEAHLADALADAQKAGVAVKGMIADQGTSEGVSHFFKAGEEAVGTPDVVILNAAIAESGEVAEMEGDMLHEMVDVNFTGYILGARQAARAMNERGGQLVMIGSLSAETRKPESAVYTATKAGIRAFAASFRKEVNKSRIRVALVEPGSVGTDMVEEDPAEQREQQRKGEMLMAEDIARAVRYILAEPERSDVIQLQVRPTLQEI